MASMWRTTCCGAIGVCAVTVRLVVFAADNEVENSYWLDYNATQERIDRLVVIRGLPGADKTAVFVDVGLVKLPIANISTWPSDTFYENGNVIVHGRLRYQPSFRMTTRGASFHPETERWVWDNPDLKGYVPYAPGSECDGFFYLDGASVKTEAGEWRLIESKTFLSEIHEWVIAIEREAEPHEDHSDSRAALEQLKARMRRLQDEAPSEKVEP